MSPFVSKQQSKAAFSGALGSKMKKAAPEWASKTNYKTLPKKVGTSKLKTAISKAGKKEYK